MTAAAESGAARAAAKTAPIATLPFLGLAAFTLIVVTNRWSFAGIAIALALIGIVLDLSKLRLPSPFRWGMMLVTWAAITAGAAISPAVAWPAVVDRLKIMLVLLVVLNAIRSEEQLRSYLLVVVAAFLIYPARGALVNYVHGYTWFGRAIWNDIYENTNYLGVASLLALGSALALATASGGGRFLRWCAASCAAIFLVVTFLTESRGTFLGLVAGFAPPLISRVSKRPALVIYLVLAGSVGLTFLPHSLWVRLSGMTRLTSTATIAQADPEGSAGQRWQIQKTAWKVFADHPLTGVGLGCYGIANARYAPDLSNRDTHNTYLNLAAELGIPGLFSWLALVWSVLHYTKRAKTSAAPDLRTVRVEWLRSGIIGYLVAGIFGSFSGLTMVYLVLGALWCGANLMLGGAQQELRAPGKPARSY